MSGHRSMPAAEKTDRGSSARLTVQLKLRKSRYLMFNETLHGKNMKMLSIFLQRKDIFRFLAIK